jgi:hypothetical protein
MDKQSSIKSLQFNTIFADNADLSNPVWTIQPNINSIGGFKVKNVCIPLTSYNIDTYNNKISIFEKITSSGNTQSNVVSIPIGNYNSLNIGSALTTALNSQGTLYMTCNFSTLSNLLNFNSTTGTFYFQPITNHAFYELGITSGTSLVSTYTAGNCLDLSGIKLLNLQTNSLDGTDIVGNNNRIICSIPIEESVNTISTFTDDSSDYIDSNIQSISQISVNLKDQYYRDIITRNHWNFTLNLKID